MRFFLAFPKIKYKRAGRTEAKIMKVDTNIKVFSPKYPLSKSKSLNSATVLKTHAATLIKNPRAINIIILLSFNFIFGSAFVSVFLLFGAHFDKFSTFIKYVHARGNIHIVQHKCEYFANKTAFCNKKMNFGRLKYPFLNVFVHIA